MELSQVNLHVLSQQHDISFKDLEYVVKSSKRGKNDENRILKKLTGTFTSNRLTAIMGSSGSGKTTLLNAISGQSFDKNVSIHGSILYNNQPITNIQQRKWAFVFQDDVILDTMTVREAITMSAQLRLPKEMSQKDKKELVEKVITDLDLSQCQNTIVGDSIKRGISGGERKRLAIAMELIREPSVIFLDEPTSGLDTYTAYSVMNQLKNLAYNDRIVVSTIHQPSSDIFHLFDDILVLHEGNIIYQGAMIDMIPYFTCLGFECPQYTNPADFLFMEILNKSATTFDEKEMPDFIKSRFTRLIETYNSPNNLMHGASLQLENRFFNDGTAVSMQDTRKSPAFTSTFFQQFSFLFGRAFKNAVRNKLMLRIKFLQTIFIGLFVGLTYYNVPSRDVAAQVQDRAGVLFFMVLNNVFSSSFGVLNVFSAEKQVFVREYRGHYYGLAAYFLSKSFVELPFNLLFPSISATVVYFMVKLQLNAAKFFIFDAIMMLSSVIGLSLGMFFASLFADLGIALAITPLILLPLMLFSGLYVNVGNIPVYFNWIQYISPMKYAFQASMINEMKGLKLPPPIFTGDNVLQQFGLTKDGLGLDGNMAILVSFWFGLVMLSYIALWRVTRRYKSNVTILSTPYNGQ
jgi:ATP-binding cassette subfamily G (WHITE) protein 1